MERSDHDLLICIDAKLRELKNQFDNHLSHHFKATILAWTTAISAIGALLILLFKQ